MIQEIRNYLKYLTKEEKISVLQVGVKHGKINGKFK